MKKTSRVFWGALFIAFLFSLGACSGRKTTTLRAGGLSVEISPGGGILSLSRNDAVLKSDPALGAGEIVYGDKTYPLGDPAGRSVREGRPLFRFEIKEIPLRVEISEDLKSSGEAEVLAMEVSVQSSTKLDRDLTVRIPIAPLRLFDETWLPLKNGTGVKLGQAADALYRFAGAPEKKGLPLALPLVSFPAGALAERITIGTDPYFSTRFTRGALEWTYPKAVGLADQPEKRTAAIVFHRGDPDAAIDQYYRTALSDVPPGPDWLHDVAMVGYDYLSLGGQGWFKDIDALETAVPAEDRPKILLCLHGWYDFVGRYCFDAQTEKLDEEWTAFSNYPQVKDKFPTNTPVRMTLKTMHDRIAYAKSRGFRVALYFADGMNAGEELADIYRPDKVLYRGGWLGPDTKGKTYCQNPLHPQVRAFFLGYMPALLREYGKEIDALVWDETFHVDTGSFGSEKWPGYADRALMRLVRDLTAQVRQYDRMMSREVAFLASDCIGVMGWFDKPPYALVSDGTYQDTHCDPVSWSYGIFPNYRNVLWSCNWEPVTHFDYTEFGVRNYQAAVAISNGWGDYRGFSALSAPMKKKVLDLFHWRKQFRTKLKWFTDLPVFQEAKK